VLQHVNVKATIELFNNSFSTLVNVEESTKECLDDENEYGDLFSWVSTSPKAVAFDLDNVEVFYRTRAATNDAQLWYSSEDYEDFHDDLDEEVDSLRINLPKIVNKGRELYQSCSKVDGRNHDSFSRRHRRDMVKFYRDASLDVVGLERHLLSDERSYERTLAILSLIEEYGCDDEDDDDSMVVQDEAVCALASQTLSLPSRRRAREVALAQAAFAFEGKEMVSI